MSICFFHNKLDYSNKRILKYLKQSNIKIEVVDINDYVLELQEEKNFKHKVYVNRVFPISKLNYITSKSYFKDLNNAIFMLQVVRHLENLGKKVINPYFGSFVDYSKTFATSDMESAKILNPNTRTVANKNTAIKLGKKLKFPMVVKQDLGGAATNIFHVKNFSEYKRAISKLEKFSHIVHIEDFVEPKDYVTRVFILNHKFQYAYKKSISQNWLGSVSQGSIASPYENPSKKLVKISERTSKKLGCPIVDLDIIESNGKYYIIDVNPTPVFYKGINKLVGFDPAKKIADYIISEHKKI